jgi:hypothetical protein
MVQIVVDCRRGTLPIRPALIALLLAPIGLIAFMTYLFVHVGDPLAFASYRQISAVVMVNGTKTATIRGMDPDRSKATTRIVVIAAALALGVWAR